MSSSPDKTSVGPFQDLAGCKILTPDDVRRVLAVERERDRAVERAATLEREVFTVCEGPCELDRDGHGGRANHCRRCPYHPLRNGDPAEAISRYLGDEC